MVAAERWGSQRLSQVYGWLFSANIPAAVSPIVAGMVFDRAGSFSPELWGLGGLMACGALSIGMGAVLKDHRYTNIMLNQDVICNHAKTN